MPWATFSEPLWGGRLARPEQAAYVAYLTKNQGLR